LYLRDAPKNKKEDGGRADLKSIKCDGGRIGKIKQQQQKIRSK